LSAPGTVNRRLFTGVVGGLILTSISVAVSLVQFSILLRRLPLEMAGIWMVFTNLGSYVLFLDLGLAPTLGREISFAAGNLELADTARAARIQTLIRSCTAVVAMLAVIVALLGATAGWSYLRTIVPVEMASATRPAWFVFTTGAALNLVGEGWFAGIYGLGYVFNEKIIRSAGAVLGLVFMTIAVFSRTGFLGLAIAYVLQSVCVLVMARITLSRLMPNAGAEGGFDYRTIRGLITPSLKYAATMLGGILILQTDNIVIASILGPAAIPNYQAVAKIVTILMTLSMMLVMTSMPIASQAYARGDIQAVVRLLHRNIRFTLGIMVILGSFVACFTDRFIAAWLGPNHFVGFHIVWVLLLVMLLEAHHQAMAASTVAAGKIVFLIPALLAGSLNIFFSIVLARRFGLIGVVSGTMIAQVTTNNWYAPWYTIRLFKMSFRHHLRTVLVPVICLIAAMLSAGAAVRMLTDRLPNIVSVGIGGISTVLIGASCFSVIMINAQERGALLGRLRAIGLRWTMLSSNLP
jgi:O-antigen/teichoic acid export membrane protein